MIYSDVESITAASKIITNLIVLKQFEICHSFISTLKIEKNLPEVQEQTVVFNSLHLLMRNNTGCGNGDLYLVGQIDAMFGSVDNMLASLAFIKEHNKVEINYPLSIKSFMHGNDMKPVATGDWEILKDGFFK